jgi:hypothetical protein
MKGPFAAMLSLFFAALLFVRADEQTKKPPGQPVAMQCVDAEGKPVMGAEVYLFQLKAGNDKRYASSDKLTTDNQGRTVCPEAVFSDESGCYQRMLYARVPGRLVGAAFSAQWTNRKAINPEGRIVMVPSRSMEGTVSVPAGFDPTKVNVEVRTLYVHSDSGNQAYLSSFGRSEGISGLENSLPGIFECRPDAKGRILFDDIPVRGRLYLVTKGPGLGEAQWLNRRNGQVQPDDRFDVPISLNLHRESRLSGVVLTPDGKPAPGMKVIARLSPHNPEKIVYLSSFESVTDLNGLFAIHGLPDTGFELSIEDPRKFLTFRPLENQLIPSGQDKVLTLTLESRILVTGRVLDAAGKPLAGASLSALAGKTGGPELDRSSTDSNGRYRLRLPAGMAVLYFMIVPEGFAYPNPQIVKELVINPGQAEIKNLDFVLQRVKK